MMVNKKFTFDEIKKSSKNKDGLLALYIYRKIAYIFTYYFINYLNVTPNQITTLALIFWVSSATLIWYEYRIFPAIFIFLGFVLDCTDGNIARLKKQISSKGKIYDAIVDRVSYSSILIVTSVKVYENYAVDNIYLLTLFLLILIIIFNLLRKNIEKKIKGDIHNTILINSYECKIKNILNKIFPFIRWDNVIIGIGADLMWTLLFLTSIFPILFEYVVTLLIILLVSGILIMIFSN